MKKALSFLLVLSMLLSMAVVAPLATSAAEDETIAVGSVADGYKPEGTAVATAAEFAAMAADGKYYLSADIVLDATYDKEFKGTLDGNGHSVTITAPVFDTFSGTVKNLTIDAKALVTGGEAGESYAAFARETNGATVTNVVNNAQLYSGAAAVAGFFGRVFGNLEMTDCVNNGAITVTAGIVAGFIAFYDDGVAIKLTNCTNNGDIKNPDFADKISGVVDGKTVDPSAGGFVAMGGPWASDDTQAKASFINCTNNGDVMSFAQVGGIAGVIMQNCEFTGCVNTGKITGNQQTANLANDAANTEHKGAYCAGIVSRIGGDYAIVHGDAVKGVFTNCVNYGTIISDRDQAGGIGAYMYATVEVKGCTNNGLVMLDMGPKESGNAAGIISTIANKKGGNIGCTIESCVNNGTVIANRHVAGILATAGGSQHTPVSAGYRVTKCANTGDLYSYVMYLDNAGAVKSNGNYGVGGIIGYVYGAMRYNEYAYIEYCTNTGNMYSSRFCGPWIEYTNELNTVIRYCVFGGTMNKIGYMSDFTNDVKLAEEIETTDDSSIQYFFALMGCSSAAYKYYTNYVDATGSGYGAYPSDANYNVKGDKVHSLSRDIYADRLTTSDKTNFDKGYIPAKLLLADNYILDNCGLEWFSYAVDDKNSANRIPVQIAIDSGLLTVVTEDKFTSGELTVMLNDKIGQTIFYQNLNDKIFTTVDKCPTTDATHAKVMFTAGAYANVLFDLNPEVTPSTGDATIYVVVALAVSALALGGLVIVKKKVRD